MKYLSFAIALLLMVSCNSAETEAEKQPEIPSSAEMESDFSKCPNGAIPAIFDTMQSELVISQHFEAGKASVEELVTFKNGVQLKLMQSGCKILKQRYEFTLPTKLEEANPQFWIVLAVSQFEEMSAIEPGFATLRDIILSNGKEVKLGLPFQGEDYSFTIDKFETEGKTLLVVDFELIYS